ncbi:MliC family protein [Chryseobacterium sp. RG1]|uniref:MliC family protein n=1 Tax=Chryseobacterium tagetis TaxID=2801334 RepID=A0ABS8A585_9FLAO|nr:MliC family protein [Chryseobacterium tagetis]MCA6069141.1 MliC family protein [Chryseobacterium tagetis]
MKKSLLILPALAALSLISCKKEGNKSSEVISDSTKTVITADSIQKSTSDLSAATPTDSAAVKNNPIIKAKSTAADGKSIDMTFDNGKNTATIVYEGETIELKGQPAASGIFYKNDHWELRGKGLENNLSKDGKVVFKGIK